MKIYLLDVYRRGPRFFYDEKSLISYLNIDRDKRDPIGNYRVTVIEGVVEKNTDGRDYLETYEREARERNLREAKLNSVLGDDYTIKVNKLIQMVRDIAPDKNRVKEKFLSDMELVPIEKKAFGKFISSYSNYLLYQVSDSVEYYRTLLDVYNFRNIKDRYTVTIYDSRGFPHYGGGVTKESNKKNFLIAKGK